jgi:hypothetical protein
VKCDSCSKGKEVFCLNCGKLKYNRLTVDQVKQNFLELGDLDVESLVFLKDYNLKSAKLVCTTYTITNIIYEQRSLVRKESPSGFVPLNPAIGDDLDPWSFELNRTTIKNSESFPIPDTSFMKDCRGCNATGLVNQRCSKCRGGIVTKYRMIEVQKGCCHNRDCIMCKGNGSYFKMENTEYKESCLECNGSGMLTFQCDQCQGHKFFMSTLYVQVDYLNEKKVKVPDQFLNSLDLDWTDADIDQDEHTKLYNDVNDLDVVSCEISRKISYAILFESLDGIIGVFDTIAMKTTILKSPLIKTLKELFSDLNNSIDQYDWDAFNTVRAEIDNYKLNKDVVESFRKKYVEQYMDKVRNSLSGRVKFVRESNTGMNWRVVALYLLPSLFFMYGHSNMNNYPTIKPFFSIFNGMSRMELFMYINIVMNLAIFRGKVYGLLTKLSLSLLVPIAYSVFYLITMLNIKDTEEIIPGVIMIICYLIVYKFYTFKVIGREFRVLGDPNRLKNFLSKEDMRAIYEVNIPLREYLEDKLKNSDSLAKDTYDSY